MLPFPTPNPRGLKRNTSGGRPDFVGEQTARPSFTVAGQHRIPNRSSTNNQPATCFAAGRYYNLPIPAPKSAESRGNRVRKLLTSRV